MEYQPGTCNIGKAETKKRAYFGMAGFILAAAIMTGILYLGWSRLALGPLLLAFVIGFEGYFQTRYRFCAGFAMQGIYDVSEDGDSQEKVTDEQAHRADLRKAVTIHMYAIGSAMLVTYLAFTMLFT